MDRKSSFWDRANNNKEQTLFALSLIIPFVLLILGYYSPEATQQFTEALFLEKVHIWFNKLPNLALALTLASVIFWVIKLFQILWRIKHWTIGTGLIAVGGYNVVIKYRDVVNINHGTPSDAVAITMIILGGLIIFLYPAVENITDYWVEHWKDKWRLHKVVREDEKSREKRVNDSDKEKLKPDLYKLFENDSEFDKLWKENDFRRIGFLLEERTKNFTDKGILAYPRAATLALSTSRKDWADAEASLKATEISDKEKAFLAHRLAYNFWHVDDLDRAIDLVLRAKKFCRMSDKEQHARINNSLAYYLAQRKRIEDATDALKYAVFAVEWGEENDISRLPEYIDTMGFVKVMFANNQATLMDGLDDLNEARRLLGRISPLYLVHLEAAELKQAELNARAKNC